MNLKMNTHESVLSPHGKVPDIQTYSEGRFDELLNISDYSITNSKLQQFPIENSNLTCSCRKELSGSLIESSELSRKKPQFRFGERLSTVIMTSESVLSRNRLQECSVHLEKLCEQRNTLMNSKKFEEQVILEEVPGLYVPVFTSRPTIAFCSHCGRDVKTKVKVVKPPFFDMLCCCVPKYFSNHEVVHLCSRCKNQLVKITM